MEIIQEGQDKRPEPLELIDGFETAHHQLIEAAYQVKSRPCSKSLEVFGRLQDEASSRVAGFYMQDFFKNAGNELYVAAAVGIIIDAASQLAEHIEQINNQYSFGIDVDEDNRELIVQHLLGADQENPVNEDEEGFDPENADPLSAGIFLCTSYQKGLEILGIALIDSTEVQSYIEQKTKREDQKNQLKNVGMIAVAVFAGTWLANKTSKK